MKRTLPTALALAVSLFGDASLDTAQMGELNRYNHRTTVGFSDRAALKRFAKIDEEEAKRIALARCRPPSIGRVTLRRKGRTLYYRLRTPSGEIRINALDGSLIRCQENRP